MSRLGFLSVVRAVTASVALLVVAGAGSASATTWSLNDFNETGTEPVGKVAVTDNGAGTLTFNVTLFGGYQFTDHADLFAFSLANDPTVTYSAFSSFMLGGSQSADLKTMGGGFGKFDYIVQGAPPSNGGSNLHGQTLTFKITAAGLDLADIAASDKGIFFATHVCEAGASATSCGRAVTGFAGGGPELPPGGGGEVPLPGALWLMGTVIAGWFGYARWRERRLA
jgi:hypothetical protein